MREPSGEDDLFIGGAENSQPVLKPLIRERPGTGDDAKGGLLIKNHRLILRWIIDDGEGAICDKQRAYGQQRKKDAMVTANRLN